ncbi:hypothetical protein C2G38_2142203 [Gigaspora rosea]|uniref:C2H2-type domain-containing protein n=1 Tax=Gigaspora rosea TaxID=44941 RepID=A0A397VAE1_9GLOM|nr:hypothetical protein C2G38_2142203 [Gigaspora rosea]
MPLCTIKIEAVVAQIVSQLDRWNIQTRRNGIITSSQGGFDFNVSGKRTIDAPDVAFTPRRKYDSLTEEQRQTFKGEPFTPTFVGTEGEEHGWNDVSGDEVLPDFTLEVWKIDQTSEPSEPGEPSLFIIKCPRCESTFNSDYLFMKHYEDVHVRKLH